MPSGVYTRQPRARAVSFCKRCGSLFPSLWRAERQMWQAYCSTSCSRAGERPDVETLWQQIAADGDCRLWPNGNHSRGYGILTLDGKTVLSHRYAWVRATGLMIPRGKVIGHTCDVRRCVRNDDIGTYEVEGVLYERRGHLWLGTQAANLADMAAKGRGASGERSGSRTHPERVVRGEACPWAKLTTDDIAEIGRLAASGISHGMIAERFPVQRRQISRILAGDRWRQ